MPLLHLNPQDWTDFVGNLKQINDTIGHLPADIVKGIQDVKASVAGATFDVFLKPTDMAGNFAQLITNSRQQFVNATVGTSNLIELLGGAGLVVNRLIKGKQHGVRVPKATAINNSVKSLADTALLQQKQIKHLLATSVPAPNTLAGLKTPNPRLSI
jgi:hypothetical protein